MVPAHVRELNCRASELDDHPIGERHLRHGRGALLGDDRPPGVLVGDDPGRVREDLAARDVVGVVVAVDEEPDRLREALGDLGLQPAGGVGVDRIG